MLEIVFIKKARKKIFNAIKKISFVHRLFCSDSGGGGGGWGAQTLFPIKIHHWTPPPLYSPLLPPPLLAGQTESHESSTFAITVKYPWLLSFCPFYLHQLIPVPMPFSLLEDVSASLVKPFHFPEEESTSTFFFLSFLSFSLCLLEIEGLVSRRKVLTSNAFRRASVCWTH